MLNHLAVSSFVCFYFCIAFDIQFFVAKLNEDFCGVEPVTHAATEVETRPPPIIDEDKLRKAYSHEHSALLGG